MNATGVVQQLTAQLQLLGWPADAGMPFAAATRGHNLVAELPPSPAAAAPLVAAVIQHVMASDTRLLVLAAPAMIGEWTATLGALVDGTSVSVVALGASDEDGASDARILIATPAAALAHHQRSQLHPDRIGSVIFAWPQSWHDDDAVAAVLQDVSRDAQRVIVTTRAEQPSVQQLAERYARKAAIVPMARVSGPTATLPPTLSATPSPWHSRASRTAALARQLVQRPLVIWTVDRRDHAAIRHAFGSLPEQVSLTTEAPVAGTKAVVCYDLPAPAFIQQCAAAHIALLATPGTEDYLDMVAPGRMPLDVSGFADAVRDRDHARRDEIVQAASQEDLAAAVYALAPLFAEHEPQQIAAALYHLWTRQPAPAANTTTTTHSAPPRRPEPGAVAKVWVGAGKKDDASVADLVAVLVREVGMDRSQIGRIELRDTFALVEVPAADADAIATRLTGLTIRRRKLLARVDSRRAAQRGGP